MQARGRELATAARSAGWFAALNASHPRWFDTDTPVAALSRRRRAAST